jgi:hypothetical protein
MTTATSTNHARSQSMWALPVAVLLFVEVALYIWMAPRGFEFTDEAYYLHNYLHWREFTGTVTFFGAFFEWPFHLLKVAGIRVFSMALLLVSSWVLIRQLMIFSSRTPPGEHSNVDWGRYLGPIAASMLYFGYLSTLRAPSYNLLCFCSAALATACLLRTATLMRSAGPVGTAPFWYGVAVGACALSKPSTAVLLVLLHMLFFIVVSRPWTSLRLLRIVALATMGVALNLIVLSLEFPRWISSLREGLVLLQLRGGYGMVDLLRELSWDMQRQLISIGPYIVGGFILLELICRSGRAHSRLAISLLSLVLVGAGMGALAGNHQTSSWWFVMASIALGLRRLEAMGTVTQSGNDTRRDWALLAVLFCMPPIFSFGTNMPLLAHSAIASSFAYSAVFLGLYRMVDHGMLTKWALALAAVLLCVPALLTQVQALTDVDHTYRQTNAMAAQDIPWKLGLPEEELLVGPHTAQILQDFHAMTQQANMPAGQAVLDLTGDGPGLIYAVGAVPLGTPWMNGGYPGSEMMAQRIIDKIPEQTLRQAWLLTSDDDPRRIKDWQAMLARRLGPSSHRLAAMTNTASLYVYKAKQSPTLNLQIWQPVPRQMP